MPDLALKRLAFALAVALAALSTQTVASAAPIWIERLAIPKADLLDEKFAASAPRSTVVPDHSSWSAILGRRIAPGPDGVARFDYAGVSPDERSAISAYIRDLSAFDPATLSRDDQLALWINLYNAATVALILDNPPLKSIRDLDDPWGRPVATAAGRMLTLSDIEHRIIRAVFDDPRIHYALNCASIGCPDLATRAYVGAELDAMLDGAARAYVNHPRGARFAGDKLVVSKIYGWYRDDFGGGEDSILAHLRIYAEGDLARRLASAKSISGYAYDWSLNAPE